MQEDVRKITLKVKHKNCCLVILVVSVTSKSSVEAVFFSIVFFLYTFRVRCPNTFFNFLCTSAEYYCVLLTQTLCCLQFEYTAIFLNFEYKKKQLSEMLSTRTKKA